MFMRQPPNSEPSCRRTASRTLAALMAMAAMLLCAVPGCDRASDATPPARGRDGSDSSNPKTPFTAVVTTGMVGDIVKNIAGERANVRALMGAGVDPHLYRPTREDVSALLAADVIFYNGLNLEGKMADTFVKVARAGKPVFAVTELLSAEFLLSPPDFQGHDDPHVWMDPGGWMKATEAVIAKLSEFDAEGAAIYQANGKKYLAELARLNDYGKERLATIPAQRRVLVTAHDAFNYFARAYGIEVLGIQGISTDSEAGLQKIESLVSLLVERNVPAVFTETSVSAKNINALIEGARARGHAVRIGGELFSDAMGPADTYEGTYVGMLDHNITVIVRALGGEAPERGMNGKLKS
jgi:manganese/zinc/iron transport system substrate-binding protein